MKESLHIMAELAAVRRLMADALVGTALEPILKQPSSLLDGGKMLRARLTMHIGMVTDTPSDILRPAAAAIELVHAASLLHDDVIDGGTLRRNAPTFWAEKGIPGAILFGDLLLFHAMALLEGLPRYANKLVTLAGEMVKAEVEQELVLRGSPLPWEQAVRVARNKTGSLFAFAAYAGGGEQPDLLDALEDAGMKLGTAYQLADDWLDEHGDRSTAGKTLGTDRTRMKQTAATVSHDPGQNIPSSIEQLIARSEEHLSLWPHVHQAWRGYVQQVLAPITTRFLAHSQTHEKARPAVAMPRS